MFYFVMMRHVAAFDWWHRTKSAIVYSFCFLLVQKKKNGGNFIQIKLVIYLLKEDFIDDAFSHPLKSL